VNVALAIFVAGVAAVAKQRPAPAWPEAQTAAHLIQADHSTALLVHTASATCSQTVANEVAQTSGCDSPLASPRPQACAAQCIFHLQRRLAGRGDAFARVPSSYRPVRKKSEEFQRRAGAFYSRLED